jgi:hypothetical protein
MIIVNNNNNKFEMFLKRTNWCALVFLLAIVVSLIRITVEKQH